MENKPSHHCVKEADLTKLQTEMSQVLKLLTDNGHDGLPTTVTKLTVTTGNLSKSVDGLKTAITAINKFMSEYEGSRKKTEKMNTNLKWVIGTLLVVITLLFGSGILK